MAGKKRIAVGLLLVIGGVFTGVALFSYDPHDYDTIWNARNMCGPLGVIVAGLLRYLFGYVFSWTIPILMFYSGAMITGKRDLVARRKLLILLGISAWFVSAITGYAGAESAAGFLGIKTQAVLQLIIGRIGTILVLSVALFLTLMAAFHRQVRNLLASVGSIRFPKVKKTKISGLKKEKRAYRSKKKRKVVSETATFRMPEVSTEEEKPSIDIPETKRARPRPPKKRVEDKKRILPTGAVSTPADDAPLPDLSLLDDYDESSIEFSRDDLIARSEMIEDKLLVYGLKGKVQKVLPGPVVTTFEFVPAPGVKVSQIASRADDLSLALAARSLRIQAPIPGKSAVGIEVPNPEPKLVLLKEMMEHFPENRDGLLVVLGKTVTGEPSFADIADMPHLLIAGATGSGKSVCINSIICSLLFTHTPATCRFILVDPKRLELITYNDIPHLLHPVITEARPTLKVLNWLTIEMDRRYRLLAQLGVKNIQSFNKKVEEGKLAHPETGDPLNRLPYYVTIIDELADLMVSLGNEIYPPITRLSQMARAVGIHLVFATQRPSVDVVTGLIKANFPTRIAFQVTSKIDSRTILDVNGAETLLGNGDMLYLPKNLPNPVRLQGAYISESEAKNVADYWRAFKGESGKIDLSESGASLENGDADIDDELYEKAKELVIIHQQGSISLVQRRLRVGYARAARLIDMLEQSGVVGPFEGSKAREVLISREEYEESR
jgi:S-DNA-T family DNA segregation ATPase FtsK/SpoIIIE